MTSPIPGFDIASLPWVKEAKAKADAAAATKAAYDAIPYSQHLADARAAVKTAQAASDAWKPDPSTMPAWMRGNTSAALSSLAQLGNPNRQVLSNANTAAQQLIASHLQSQLNNQASRYGFGWKGNKDAAYHTGLVAGQLSSQGIEDLSQLGYSKDQNYLINKETGKQLDWYKSAKHPNEGPLANRGQLGWGAKGVGRTNYMVKADAAGNPVIFPEWKSNAPTGLGGFLVDIAPAIAGYFGGPLGAAAMSGLEGAIGGQDLGSIIKGAGINAIASGVSPYVSNLANASLPMLGTAGITNAVADAVGGAAAGGVGSALSGQGLSGVIPGALAAGVSSGVNSLGQSVSGGLQQAGLSPNLSNTATQIGAGGLSNLITSGGNLDAALAGVTNSAIGAAGQAVAGNLPNTGNAFANKLASGVTNAGVTMGLNNLINGSSSSTAPSLASHIGVVDPRLMQRAVTNPVVPNTAMPPGVVAPTNTTTAFNAPVKSMPTTGMTSVTDPEMLKKLGLG